MIAPETSSAVTGFISAMLAVIFVLLLLSGLVFVCAVTYLNQWDRYYPPLHKWLQARKKAKHEKERSMKKYQAKLRRKGNGRD